MRKSLALACTCILSLSLPALSTAASDADENTTTAAATWTQIDKNLKELEGLIQAGKIGDLGSTAYGIANLFKRLPAQSSTLPADKQAEVKKDVKVVGSEVSKLDKAGEHGDVAGVKSNLESLKATLASARSYYPK